jgi:DNA-binding transcriptional LysR family regulator
MDRLTATRVFVAVVDRGSQTAAAEHLNLSRAMVSRYLATLERWIGARLLHRTTRKLSLTQVGGELLPLCREMLLSAERMRSTGLLANDEPRGNLRITCSQSFAQTWLSPVLVEYLARHPKTSINLQISSQAVNLVEEGIDLALRITNQLDPHLVARQLGTCHSVICATPGYLQQAGTLQHPRDLGGHNCLTYSYFGRSTWQFQNDAGKEDVAVNGNMSSNDSGVLLEACLAGGGVCMQPRYVVASLLATGQLAQVLPQWQPRALGIFALYASRRQMLPALRTLLDFVAEKLAADPRWEQG